MGEGEKGRRGEGESGRLGDQCEAKIPRQRKRENILIRQQDKKTKR